MAGEMGADMVEMDVRRSADDVLILHHDASLPDGRNIAEVEADDLPPHIPTLAEALEVCQDLGVVVEIKNDPGDPGYDSDHQISVAVAGTLRAYKSIERLLVISFNLESINRIQKADPEIATGFLVFDPMAVAQSVEVVSECNHNVISWHSSIITSSRVTEAHALGLEVHTWTVNDADQIRQKLQAGVDAVVTDKPDLGVRIRDEFVAGL